MTINEIIDYIINSPENTNPNVLRSMLGDISSGGQELPEHAVVMIPVAAGIIDGAYTLNKTWQELTQNDYYTMLGDETFFFLTTGQNQDGYIVKGISFEEEEGIIFYTDSPQGYPTAKPEPIDPDLK